MFCTQCGARNPDGSKFCMSCGTTLAGPVMPPQLAPDQPTLRQEQPAAWPADPAEQLSPWHPTPQPEPGAWAPTAQAQTAASRPTYPAAESPRPRPARRGLRPWLWGLLGFVAVLLIAAVVVFFVWEDNPLRSLLGGRGPEYIAFLDEDYNVAIVLPDGSEEKALTEDGDLVEYGPLAWSPDHRLLGAYREDRGRDEYELWIGRADGEEAETIRLDLRLGCDEHTRCMDWSPNSQKVAIVGFDQDWEQSLLAVADVKTGKVETIDAEEDEEFYSVAWLPAGDRLAVTILRRSASELYIQTMRDDGSDQERMTLEEERDQVGLPIFSLKGGRMAYVTYDTSTDTSRLYVCKSDGSDAQRVAKADYALVPLSWSRDGSRLLYYNHEDEELLVYDVRSGDEYKVADSEGELDAYDFGAALSPDGKSVAFYNIDYELIRFDLETEDDDRVAKFADYHVAW